MTGILNSMVNSGNKLTIGELQHRSFLNPAMRLGLQRSTFEPLRFISLQGSLGREVPDRLLPLPFGSTPAVVPSTEVLPLLGIPPSGISSTGLNARANLLSGFRGGLDPTDIDPETGLPRIHQSSLFKTAAAPTTYLPASVAIGQLPVPFDPGNTAFHTPTGAFMPFQVAPSPQVVDWYRNILIPYLLGGS